MPHYRYKVRQVKAVQVVDNGDVIFRLACHHLQVQIGYVNTNDPDRWVTITASDARAEVGRRRQCIGCGGDFGDDAQGFVIRHRRACGGDTFIAKGGTYSRRCARCHQELDVPAILAQIAAHPFEGSV
jgi:hypothetical protein